MTMHRFPVRRGLRGVSLAAAAATLALVAATAIVAASSASAGTPAAAGCSSGVTPGPTHVGRIGGMVRPTTTGTTCASRGVKGFEAPYAGTPPLIYHGGPMMSTRATDSQVVVTPIYWQPSGFTFTASYKSTITGYLNDLAHDSGKLSNVFATTFQYSGSNGGINYRMQIGTPITDTTALPADGCTLEAGDTSGIYADNSGYSHCIDNAQVIAETNGVVSSQSLPSDLGHLYVLFLPKHVESCFNPGATNTSANFCSLNHQLSAAYCAYHSQAPTGTVYANMPFPAYTVRDRLLLHRGEPRRGHPVAERRHRRRRRDQSTQPRDGRGDHRSRRGDRLVRRRRQRERRRLRLHLRRPLRHGRRELQPGRERAPLPDPGGVQQQGLRRGRQWLRPGDESRQADGHRSLPEARPGRRRQPRHDHRQGLPGRDEGPVRHGGRELHGARLHAHRRHGAGGSGQGRRHRGDECRYERQGVGRPLLLRSRPPGRRQGLARQGNACRRDEGDHHRVRLHRGGERALRLRGRPRRQGGVLDQDHGDDPGARQGHRGRHGHHVRREERHRRRPTTTPSPEPEPSLTRCRRRSHGGCAGRARPRPDRARCRWWRSVR